jgi:DDE domain
LLVERGVEVDHVAVFRWVQRFTPLLAEAARFCRHSPGDRWFVDETYVQVNGIWRYAYRAIDQHGQVVDVLVSDRRDGAAARRFFHRALSTLTVTLTEVVTDAAVVYPGDEPVHVVPVHRSVSRAKKTAAFSRSPSPVPAERPGVAAAATPPAHHRSTPPTVASRRHARHATA